jgi:hypothetical protein
LILRQWLENACSWHLVVDGKGKVTEYRVRMKVTFILNKLTVSLTRTAAA